MTGGAAPYRTAAELLGQGERRGDVQDFELGEHLYSVWGGLHGGAVAAVLLLAGRSVAPDRVPLSLDTRFLRATGHGSATVSCRLLNHGRTLTNIGLELIDPSGRTTATGTATFVDESQLRTDLRSAPPAPLRRGSEPLPLNEAMRPPILGVLDVLYTYPGDGGWLVTPVTCPWSDTAGGAAELACLAADMVQGAAAYTSVEGQQIATPNPDLAMRFTGSPMAGDLAAEACPRTLGAGRVVVESRVRTGDTVLAHGMSSCTLLPMGG